jgi:hypothetical protein
MALPQRLPRWLKVVNPIVIRLNRWGLAVGTMHVLTIRGRTSGKPYSAPVSLLNLDGQRYIVSLPWVNWVKNARVAGVGLLERGSRVEQVRLVELSLEERTPVVRAFPVQVPGGVAFFQLPADPEAFERVAPQLTAFRVEPATGGAAA